MEAWYKITIVVAGITFVASVISGAIIGQPFQPWIIAGFAGVIVSSCLWMVVRLMQHKHEMDRR